MLIKKQSLTIIYILILFISCLLLPGVSSAYEYTRKNDDLSMKAIVRADNDFTNNSDIGSKRENIPEIVSKKIRSLLKKCKTIYYRYDKSAECKYLVFKVKYTDTISIYICKIDIEPGLRYYFIAYDSKTSGITDKPPWIYGVYMENDEGSFLPEYRLLEKPLIYFCSFDFKNSKGTVVIKYRGHNGNAYNVVIDEYYWIDSHMNLHNFLNIESRALAVQDEGYCMINRTLKNNVLVSTLKCKNEKPKLIGSVKLKISKNKVRIVSMEVNDKSFENDKRWLVTVGQDSPEASLNAYVDIRKNKK